METKISHYNHKASTNRQHICHPINIKMYGSQIN